MAEQEQTLAKAPSGKAQPRKRKRADPSSKEGRAVATAWSAEHDATVRDAHERLGNNWAKIAELLPGRNHVQVRNRYVNHLDPARTKAPWTPDDDEMLWQLQAAIGNRWAEIAQQMPGRSDNDVKNRWHTCRRHEQRKLGLLGQHGGQRTGAAWEEKKLATKIAGTESMHVEQAPTEAIASSDAAEQSAEAARTTAAV